MSEYDELFDTDLDTDVNFEFCDDEEQRFKGLDRHAAETWIYPTNLPFRQYQFDIVQTALFHNTMVSLPTGLGKTMIAAVVMYNMYRWYPLGRIIFMAPTRPLVAQQADACRKITCIPKDHTIQLTGDTQNTTRGPIWENTRVFFITPQILQKDLQSKICPAHLIRCIVIDEAHRARGNYAYCEVLRLLGDHASRVRILALSATPGATSTQVAEVCKALKISRLEIRTESSVDVKPYVFSKITETIVVPLGEPLASIRDEYIEILDQYTRRLMKNGVLTGSAGNIHRGRIFMIQKEYKENCQRMGKRPDNYILQDLTFCLTLYHAFEVLIKHGLRGFVSFYDEHGGDKGWVRKDERLKNLLNKIKTYLGPLELNLCPLPDGTIPEIDPNIVFGHPKFNKLRDICQQHFTKYPDTRVMIFCEYRDSVQEALAALLICRPLIRPRMFLGQSAISQKQQIAVMEKFRQGECNTLICTCVAEEGLDVAAVQLIICFDIANRSPIRLAQRMGRTGRHQIGRVVILVTEGREQQTLAETMQQSSLLDEKLVQSIIVKNSLLPDGPSMLPPDIQPKYLELHMESTDDKTKKKTSPGKEKRRRNAEDNIELEQWNQKIPEDNYIPEIGQCLWTFSKDDLNDFKIAKSNKFLTLFTPTNFLKQIEIKSLFGPSEDTKILTSVYKKCEKLKFNLPVKNLKSNIVPKTKNRDIREMFGKSVQSQQDNNDFILPNNGKIEQQKYQESQKTQTISTNNSVKTNSSLFVNFLSELSTYKTVQLLLEKTCHICDKFFICEKLTEHLKFDDEPQIKFTVPDESILTSLTYENLKNFEIPTNYYEDDYFDFERYNNEKEFEKLRQIHDPSYSVHDFFNEPVNPLTLGDHIRDPNHSILNENRLENMSKISLGNISFKTDFDSFIENEFEKSHKSPDISLKTSHIEIPRKSEVNSIQSKNIQKSPNISIKPSIHTVNLSENLEESTSKSIQNSSNITSRELRDESFISDLNITGLQCDKEKSIYENNSIKDPNSFSQSFTKNKMDDESINNETFEGYSYNKSTRPKKWNISVYVPDEISKKALNFFGLNNVEDLFEDDTNQSRLNKLAPKHDTTFDITSDIRQKQKTMKKTCSDKTSDKTMEDNLKIMIPDNEVINCSSEKTDITQNYPISPILFTQKRLSSQLMTENSSPFFNSKKEYKDDFVLWDESLFIDDSEVFEQKSSQNLTSPILNTQRSTQKKRPKISLCSGGSKVCEQNKSQDLLLSPILNTQRTQTKRTKIDFSINDSEVSKENKEHSSILRGITNMEQTSQTGSQNNFGSSNSINLDYLSDEDIFAEHSTVDNQEFFTASEHSLQTQEKMSQKDDRTNIIPHKRIFVSTLDDCTKNTFQKENFTNTLNNHTNNESQKENFANTFNDRTNNASQKENFEDSRPNNTKRKNKLNIFQLKRNFTELNPNIVSNTISNQNNVKNDFSKPSTSYKVTNYESDSDVSLLDFTPRPIRKKLRLGLKKLENYDESIENEKDASGSSGGNNSSINLSQFEFINRKKVLGQENSASMSYETYRNNGQQQLVKNMDKTKTKKKRSVFIDFEAEVSEDDEDISDDDDDTDGDLESSFVVDNLESTQSNVDMHALYLQSVKNNSQMGKFKIPNLPPVKMADICSQADWNEADSNYVIDSFCVDNTIVMNEELSLLEIAEMKLEREKRKRKKRNTTKKLTRIRRLSDESSSEDEDIKKLRLECLNNQSVLR